MYHKNAKTYSIIVTNGALYMHMSLKLGAYFSNFG